MILEFEAHSTSYSEAIDGEIVQVIFEEEEELDLLHPKYKSLCLSINYEFPPRELDVQWSNAHELGGGKIIGYKFSENSLDLQLDRDVSIYIKFHTDKATHGNIKALLLREVGEANTA